MGLLVGEKARDVDAAKAPGLVAPDEILPLQLVQQAFAVRLVRGKDLHLDPAGPVLQAALAVRQAPQADEEQARCKGAPRQLIALEEGRLDVPGPHTRS
jgi:hypothetical protein